MSKKDITDYIEYEFHTPNTEDVREYLEENFHTASDSWEVDGEYITPLDYYVFTTYTAWGEFIPTEEFKQLIGMTEKEEKIMPSKQTGYQLADGTYSSEYKVGDKFVVIADDFDGDETYSKFSVGSLVELCDEVGSKGSPLFKLLKGECGYRNAPDGSRGAYAPWKNVKANGATKNKVTKGAFTKSDTKSSFTKSDLKDGMLVAYRNGWERIVFEGELIYKNSGELGKYLSEYTLDLLNASDAGETLDIVKVAYMGEVVWEREEAPTPSQLKQQRITKELEFAEAKRERLNAHIERLKKNLNS